jgi:hypothetical protein
VDAEGGFRMEGEFSLSAKLILRQAKLGERESRCSSRNFHCDPRVRVPTGQGRGPPAGSESCVARPRGPLRSVDSGCVGGEMEPRELHHVEADAVIDAEGNKVESKRRAASLGS